MISMGRSLRASSGYRQKRQVLIHTGWMASRRVVTQAERPGCHRSVREKCSHAGNGGEPTNRSNTCKMYVKICLKSKALAR